MIELLITNTSLAKNWKTYYKNIQVLGQTPENLEFSEQKLKSLLNAVENISSRIMSDNIVQNCLNNLYPLRGKLIEKNCARISAEFSNYIRLVITNLDKIIQERPSLSNMYKCIKVNALFVLNSNLFGTNDKKVFRALIDLNTKVFSFHIACSSLR